MQNRKAEYRRRARDCLELVRTVASEEARAALIEMARVWTRLADEAPVVQQQQQQQQQQQIQPKKGE